MEALVRTSPTTYTITPKASKLKTIGGFNGNRSSSLIFANGYGSTWTFSAQKIYPKLRKSVVVEAKKKNEKSKQKFDTHSFAHLNLMKLLALSLKLCFLKRRKFRKMEDFCPSLRMLRNKNSLNI